MGITANKEMNKLIDLLSAKGIPFEVAADVWHDEACIIICSPSVEECRLDAASHYYTYGGQQGLIEVMGHGDDSEITSDDVVGWLSAEEALAFFERL